MISMFVPTGRLGGGVSGLVSAAIESPLSMLRSVAGEWLRRAVAGHLQNVPETSGPLERIDVLVGDSETSVPRNRGAGGVHGGGPLNVIRQEQVMTTDQIRALEALLAQTESAHGVFETTALKGVYDEAWPRWYAQYAIDHGIGDLLGRAVTVDQLARFLATSWDEVEHDEQRRSEPWPTYTARGLARDL